MRRIGLERTAGWSEYVNLNDQINDFYRLLQRFVNQDEVKFFVFYGMLYLTLIGSFLHCVNDNYWLAAGLLFLPIVLGTIGLLRVVAHFCATATDRDLC